MDDFDREPVGEADSLGVVGLVLACLFLVFIILPGTFFFLHFPFHPAFMTRVPPISLPAYNAPEAYAPNPISSAGTSTDQSFTQRVGSLVSGLSAPQAQLPVNSAGELPVKIAIAEAEISASVSNPSSTNLSVLDKALLSGAVRYPTTALLGAPGTILIFGHSSYLPKIHNPAFRTFDGVQNLKAGDPIDVYSSDADYRYAFKSVRVANAYDSTQNVIPLIQDGQHLVIVTCDTLLSTSARFVVQADFVGKYSI